MLSSLIWSFRQRERLKEIEGLCACNISYFLVHFRVAPTRLYDKKIFKARFHLICNQL